MPQHIRPDALLALAGPVITIVRIERLGDIVACEPVIRHAKKTCPDHKIAWIAREQHFEALAGHPLLDYLVSTRHLAEATEIASRMAARQPVINLHFHNSVCPVTRQCIPNGNDARIISRNYYHWGSLLEAFSLCARLPRLSDAPEFHILPETPVPPLPERYVAFHCLANEQDRNWNTKSWKKLLYFFFSRGMPVIELGFAPLLASSNVLYHDMTRVHSLQAIAKILSAASFFFGVDSAFAHMANALRVNGLVIMGKYREFTRHVPYTGKYGSGHIVRCCDAPASAVSHEDVIRQYCAMQDARSGAVSL
ncbi:MAG: hypothetical protein LBC79_01845 [Deltaproteobacteria bacterium]|jgi:heptosyltransferase-3|nr:hypothetical protein [Deltaproteobacteria bacterium]